MARNRELGHLSLCSHSCEKNIKICIVSEFFAYNRVETTNINKPFKRKKDNGRYAIEFGNARSYHNTVGGIVYVACTILGIVVIVWFYGTALKSAIMVMFHQPEGVALLPAMTFCAVFFMLLNLYLRRKYTTT